MNYNGLKSKLIDNGTFEGMWWLPNKPEEKIFGIATVDDTIRNLRLFGKFNLDSYNNNQTLYGENPDGSVTLFDCSLEIMKYISQSNSNLSACNIWFGDIVENTHLSDENSFSRISFKLPYIDMLTGERYHLEATKKISKPISIKISQPYNGIIKIVYQKISTWNITKGNTFKENYIVDIEFEDPLVAGELIIIARNFLRFINLLYRRNTYINCYNLKSKDGKNSIKYKSNHSIKEETKKESYPRLRIKEVNKNVGIYISNWLKHTIKEDPKYLWFFEVENSKSMFIEQKFLAIIHSIDGIISINYPVQVENIPENILKKITETLKNDNEISSKNIRKIIKKLEKPIPNSLSQRLKRVIDSLPNKMLKKYKSIDIEDFCVRTNSVRNYLSHLSNYNEKRDIKNYPHEYLLFLKDILNFLFF